jgi:hypothetical protein
LVEGVCCVLAETVWRNVSTRVNDSSLRVDIEGHYATEEFLKPNDMSDDRYDSYDEAMKLIDLVGIARLLSAFLYGHTGHLGGPAGDDAVAEVQAEVGELLAGFEHDLPQWRQMRAEAASLLTGAGAANVISRPNMTLI